jgi:excisionase family DNA binding protein
VRPIQDAPITSGFGERWGRLHAGVDFGAPIGTPIYAASHGTVTAVGPASGYGRWVKIQHAGAVSTVYGHISRWTVTVGQAVQPGQLIAYSGNEGRSTGPHLHFEVRPQDRARRPRAFLPAARQRPAMSPCRTGEPRSTGKGLPVLRQARRPFDSAAPARVPTRVRPDRAAMASAHDTPEPAFSPASRQRLVRQLLEAERDRCDAAGTARTEVAAPTSTQPDATSPTATRSRHDQHRATHLSVAETADLLGISRWLVQQATHDGSLPSVRVGRRILIPRSRLLAWLDGQHDPSAPEAARDIARSEADRTVVPPRRPQVS